MKYNLDEVVDRRGTKSEKWDSIDKYGIEDLLPMWVADMDFRSPEFILKKIQERATHPVLGYSYRDEDFTSAVAGWQKRRNGWDVKEEWVTYSPGVVSSLSISVLAMTNPGDKIVVQTPVYFPFFDVVEGTDRVLLKSPLKEDDGKFRMDYEMLEKHFKDGAKAILMCSPHNPIGRVWTREELEKLVGLCAKYDVYIFSDEIHSDMIFQGHKHIPIASLSEEAARRSVVSFSASKSFNVAGLSTSAVIIPDKEIRVKYERSINGVHIKEGNLFGNIAIIEAFTNGDSWIEQLNEYLYNNIKYVKEYISENLPKIKVIEPEASFLIWLDFSNYELSNSRLQHKLVKRGRILLNNGNAYGEDGEGFFRMNIGCPLITVKEGLNRIKIALSD